MRFRSGRWFALPASIALAFLILGASSSFGWQQQSRPMPGMQDEDRERYQRSNDLLKALELTTGDWVADVGAGNGYYAQRMAEIIGPTGKVFAEDIADYAIAFLRMRVGFSHLRNVEIIKGDVDNPKLPPESLAAVLVVNAYHEFTEYEPVLKQILRALKPGGRLVIADYSLPDHRNQSRADQLQMHEIAPALVRAEVERAGYELVKCEDPFLKRMPKVKGGCRIASADLWLMVAIRPK